MRTPGELTSFQVDNVEVLPATTPKKHTPNKGSQKCHTCALSVLVLKRVAIEGSVVFSLFYYLLYYITCYSILFIISQLIDFRI